MNSLERTLIHKAGYDHGWEVVVEDSSERVVLASALHPSRATVVSDAETDARWMLILPPGPITREMLRAEPELQVQGDRFRACNDLQLGRLLHQAARLARALPNAPETRFAETVARELNQTGPTSATEVERMVRQRVGQDIYRESLLDYWGGACAVTGITLPVLLRASHAKPWAECASDAERLNVFNGFLLAAHLDALFDRHLMTFDDTGSALFAPQVDQETRNRLGLTVPPRLSWISPEHLPFLHHHRAEFQRLSEE